MFITFEGIDGSGKTTHFKRLHAHLLSKSIEVETYREPGGSPLAEIIRDILLNPEIDINDTSELLLFEAARADLINKKIKPALRAGKWVMLDRFFDSTYAYQGHGRGLNLENITLLNSIASQRLTPDMTFYMRIPLEESLRRVNKHNRGKDRIEQADVAFFTRVFEGFEEAAKINKDRTIIIDGMDSKDEVSLNIISHLDL